MKTIGLLGGMSWESTLSYYRLINESVRDRLGGLHSASIAMRSVDFASIEALQRANDWGRAASLLITAARQVQEAGADCLLICTNTMHKVAPEITAAVNIPLLHIADASAKALQRDNIRCAGLLGTAFTMEQDFYKSRLTKLFGIDVVVPDAADRAMIHQVIYTELCLGKINAASKKAFLQVIAKLQAQGAEGMILGCTEIGLLVQQSDTGARLYDTTRLHAESAVDFSLGSPGRGQSPH